jgi:preprotein translocase subunit SecA
VLEAELQITLHHVDEGWAAHLSEIARVRESIHLVGLGGLKPLNEFRKQVSGAFEALLEEIDERVIETFKSVEFSDGRVNLGASGLKGPSSTWTYLVNDHAVGALQEMLFGEGSYATGAGAAMMAGPLILLWGIRERLRRRS